MLSFFPRGVLDEILNLIESVSEDFPSYSSMGLFVHVKKGKSLIAVEAVRLESHCILGTAMKGGSHLSPFAALAFPNIEKSISLMLDCQSLPAGAW